MVRGWLLYVKRYRTLRFDRICNTSKVVVISRQHRPESTIRIQEVFVNWHTVESQDKL